MLPLDPAVLIERPLTVEEVLDELRVRLTLVGLRAQEDGEVARARGPAATGLEVPTRDQPPARVGSDRGLIELKSEAGRRGLPLCQAAKRPLLEHLLATGRRQRPEAFVFGRADRKPFTPDVHHGAPLGDVNSTVGATAWLSRPNLAGHRPRVYLSNTCSKPPQNIRRLSKGISISIASGSALIFSLAASRVVLSGYSIQLKMTVSSSFACVARKKSVTSPRGTSSPQHSVTRVAPRFLK